MIVLAHLSDLHLDGGERAARRAARVMAFLDRLREPVDAVLVTGDLADHGTPDEYAEVRRLIADRPVLHCPGNHDVRGPYREVLLGEPACGAPINAVHDLGALRIALCDSSIPGRHDGHLADETLEWLDGALALTPAGVPALVGFHHPPVVLHNAFIDGIRQGGAERLERLLRRHPHVLGVLCGHAHTAAVSTFAGLPLLVAPGVRSTLRLPWETELDLDESMPPAIAFHVIAEGRLTTHYRLVV